MVGRFFALWTLLVPALAPAAEGAWRVDEVVARALADERIEAVLQSRLASLRAGVAEATAHPAPGLGVSHEQVLGDEAAEYREISVVVQQELDLSDRRARLREALPHREAALRARREAWRLEVATAVRRAFFEVRYRQERSGALAGWIERLGRGVRVIEVRERHGDASAYDVRRVQREVETAKAARVRETSLLAEAWASLGVWVPLDTPAELIGDLRPPPPAPEADLSSLPNLARLEHEERALGVEQEAWGSPFLRGWTVGAGFRRADLGSATGHGFILSLDLPLTLWNTDAPKVERLRAERARAGGEIRLRRALAERAEAAAHRRVDEALAALGALSPPEHDAELTRLAETAYAAGEASLTELLDAYESQTELDLSRVDLQWEARRASIELDRRRGKGARP